MPLILITTNPRDLVTTFETDTADLDLPGVGPVPGATAGYTSPDGAYKLLAFTHFVPPPGKVISGGPIYVIDDQFNVTERFGITDAPNPAAVTPAQFRNFFTPEERLAITIASLTNAQIRVWIDDCLFLGVVNLTSTEVLEGMAFLVANNFITQARSDEILAFRTF